MKEMNLKPEKCNCQKPEYDFKVYIVLVLTSGESNNFYYMYPDMQRSPNES